jgi:hypothetical protein
MLQLKFFNYEAPGKCSVWLGTRPRSREELSAYIELKYDEKGEGIIIIDGFSRDFAIPSFDHDFIDCMSYKKMMKTEQLIQGLSYINTFSKGLLREAKKAKLLKATTIIVFYDFDYEKRPVTESADDLTFIGSFKYSTRQVNA